MTCQIGCAPGHPETFEPSYVGTPLLFRCINGDLDLDPNVAEQLAQVMVFTGQIHPLPGQKICCNKVKRFPW